MLSTELFLTIGRLFLLTGIGFVLFRIPLLQNRVLPVLLKVLLWVGFPMYSISRIGSGWDQAVEQGWQGMAAFFAAGVGMIGLQFVLGRFLLRRLRVLKTEYRRELLILFALHNAGYLPLPIFSVLLPEWMMVYVFYYVVAFNLLFWTFSIPLLESGNPKFALRITPPLAGILLGIAMAAFGLYQALPTGVQVFLRQGGTVSLDIILVALGGALAPVSFQGWRQLRELRWLAALRMAGYPLAVSLLTAILVRVLANWVEPAVATAVGFFILVEAAMPPATNTMIVTRAYGSPRQNEVIGGGMLLCYGAALVSLPVFLLLGELLF